ncbi:NUDIX hydrolase domain-like protein [Irpex rosettiformis]|uniref:NUDIX hydrolase domain-like protein n=1 Tax=Irpex rosettiformis TaxID=378272 RepID=A0ACB8U1H0_9APHY|nr:NUDIX hydrolase domain-like protein [Irpex rosettiformis]
MLRSPFYNVQIRQISSSAKGHTNFFAGSPLNRLSWLRQSPIFLNAIVSSPATRWIVFNDGKPLMATGTSGPTTLARLSTNDVRPWLGLEPIFSQGQHEGSVADPEVTSLQSSRLHGPPIIFLGLHEDENAMHALPSSEFSAKKDAQAMVSNVHGTPYFSLDVTELEEGNVSEVLNERAEAGSVKLEFLDGRAAMGSLTQFDSAVFAEARSLVDWSARNRRVGQYCAGCGSPVYTLWAGWKHACSSLLPWAPRTTTKPCPTGKALNNYLHPRTDPVVIILTVSPDNGKILLGRNKSWPKNFYSALAGFVEPGESLEDTVERELWEEAGIKVLGLKYHSTQPWPFPANIMAGFYAVADPSQPVRTDLDNELEDARWYTREEVLSVLNHTEGLKTGKDAPKWDSGVEEKVEEAKEVPEKLDEPPFKGPPRNAMAGVLLSDWASGKVDIKSAL